MNGLDVAATPDTAKANAALPISLPMIALAATLIFLAIQWWTGFATLYAARGDNDGMMRLVEVRDLLAGQGWFDLMQYRLGPDGILMHWSRLVDAPIAGLILLAEAVGYGRTAAEAFAAIAWPLFLFFAAMLSVLHAATRMSGPSAALPATIVAGVSFYYIGFFAPASLDHHNAQLTLTLAMLAGLTAGHNRFWPAAGAGMAAAAMIAIGMETAPYVAVGAISVAILHVLRGERDLRTVQGFGLGFGTAALVIFAATVPSSSWMRPACDAYSVAQFALAALGGFGIAALATARPLAATTGRRAASLAVLGAACAKLLLVAFPQCLSDPYSMVDPWLKANWLDHISEAQSVLDIARESPAKLVAFYAYGIFAIVVLVALIRRQGAGRTKVLLLGVLCATLAVGLWQVRGALFLISMSAIPLAGWIAEARTAAAQRPSSRNSLRMAGAWIFSFILTWLALGAGFNAALASIRGTELQPLAVDATDACYERSDYATLAAVPATSVLSITNLGSALILNTPHRALAGPYHRNLDGNRMALQVLLASPADAEPLARASGATVIAWCPGNAESKLLAETNPDGLAAALRQDQPPAWLTPLPAPSGDKLKLYRIAPTP